MSEGPSAHWYLLPGDALEHYDGRRATFKHRVSATEVYVRTEGNAAEVWNVALFAPLDPAVVCEERAGFAEQRRREFEVEP